jgi:hypothetical protein
LDPASLIVAALAAGAMAGAQDAAEAVKDAYSEFRALPASRLRGRPAGEEALERHATSPDQWARALEAEIVISGMHWDSKVLSASQQLLTLVVPAASQAGKYVIDAAERGAYRWAITISRPTCSRHFRVLSTATATRSCDST